MRDPVSHLYNIARARKVSGYAVRYGFRDATNIRCDHGYCSAHSFEDTEWQTLPFCCKDEEICRCQQARYIGSVPETTRFGLADLLWR